MAGNYCDVIGTECHRMKQSREDHEADRDAILTERDSAVGKLKDLEAIVDSLRKEIADHAQWAKGMVADPNAKWAVDLMNQNLALARFARLFSALHILDKDRIGEAAREAMDFLEKHGTI
jgi:hypothetical protein